MRRIALTALGLGLLISAAPAEGEGDSLDPLASLKAAEFLAHVKWLADDAQGGRLSGSPDERRATQYIAEQMESYGLKPAGEDGGWYQYFKVPNRSEAGTNNHLRVGQRDWTLGKDFRPLGKSPKLAATGRMVFAGYGYSDPLYDDYEDLDAEGAIVVAIRLTPEVKPPGVEIKTMRFFLQTMLTSRQIQAAQNAGAAGLILIPAASAKDSIGVVSGGGRMARMMSRNPATIPVAVATRKSMADVLAAADIDLAAWEHQTQQAKAPARRADMGNDASLATEVVSKPYQGRNVIGVLEGSDPVLKHEYVVIGAHCDHVGRNEAGNATDANNEIHNGADDNASGTAGMLELAQAFATCAFKPRRSMVFMAFSGEELGLLGSRAWVKKPTLPLGNVVAMINLDMIGRSVNGKVTAEATASSPGFKDLVLKHNTSLGLDVRFTKGVRGDSDHYSFYAGKVPVIFFFTGLHKDYHKSTDTWEKINHADAERTLQLAYLVAAELTANETRPEYKAVKRPTRPGRGRGRRVQLGIFPDFEFDGQGARAGSITPGSPAEKAGMKAGDVIVKIGERDVGNMQDLQMALAQQKPGNSVDVVVVRKGERKTLKVTFAGRG